MVNSSAFYLPCWVGAHSVPGFSCSVQSVHTVQKGICCIYHWNTMMILECVPSLVKYKQSA